MARTNLTDSTVIARMPKGTRVRVDGFATPAEVYFYRQCKQTGTIRVCVRFTRIAEEHTWVDGPGPAFLNVTPQRIRRLVAKGAEVSHAKGDGSTPVQYA